MTEVPVQRKKNHLWIWLVLLVVAILLIWWWVSETAEVEPDRTAEYAESGEYPAYPEAAPSATSGPATGDVGRTTIAAILDNPSRYIGREDITLQGAVPDVPTDRGFWIEDGGRQLFALIIDQPREVPKDINPDQRLEVRNGMLRGKDDVAQLPGEVIDQDTRAILDEQDVFLVVDESDIEILSRP
ncbi:hypothetical protein B2G71_21545 [Novosphingobium sp. PC22D]|uniref:hypothetical protein n=1 Tax=Novosphingobium sp. PC22D TaxID=1962403 RepID=UPI000BEF6889|nr:hypothetical protein [Novosphingobium sp. PC22D]PEQ10570.1 hypothetical protein B2G71_21545 [Novosphingobium sp. PC22D]